MLTKYAMLKVKLGSLMRGIQWAQDNLNSKSIRHLNHQEIIYDYENHYRLFDEIFWDLR